MIKLIAACDPYGGIGFDGQIPWHVPEDMKLFKELTTGHTVFMGRKTYDSIGKALPNRINVIATRSLGRLSFIQLEGKTSVVTTSDIDWAEKNDSPDKTIWIIGGAEIYNHYLKNHLVQEVYLTVVNSDEICDSRIHIDHIHRYYAEDLAYKQEFLSTKENRMCSLHLYRKKPEI